MRCVVSCDSTSFQSVYRTIGPSGGHGDDLVKINLLAGPREPLLATVKREKNWHGSGMSYTTGLSKPILQGTPEDGRRRSQQRKFWTDVDELTVLPTPELLAMASWRKVWKTISTKSSSCPHDGPIMRSTDWSEVSEKRCCLTGLNSVSFNRCIFSEDRLFLRRLAYVVSRDGTGTATYRPGFNGGIWQVRWI